MATQNGDVSSAVRPGINTISKTVLKACLSWFFRELTYKRFENLLWYIQFILFHVDKLLLSLFFLQIPVDRYIIFLTSSVPKRGNYINAIFLPVRKKNKLHTSAIWNVNISFYCRKYKYQIKLKSYVICYYVREWPAVECMDLVIHTVI